MDDYYEEQTQINNYNYQNDRSNIIKKNYMEPEDELAELYEIREKMENDIRQLWDNVIVPYLNDYRYNDILKYLTTNDYHKFYEYMIDNNKNFNYVCKRIYELETI